MKNFYLQKPIQKMIFLLSIVLCLMSNISFSQSICFDPAADNKYETNPFPMASAAADFNSDGKLDIATANPGQLDILFGNATANNTFQAKITYTHDLSTGGIAAADFNNDTKPDVVVFGASSHADLALFINNGTGSFSAPIYFNYGSNNGSGLYNSDMRMADFNADGRQDLVVNDKNLDRLYILRNNGNSTFTVADTLITGDMPNSLAVGDLNNDGKPEVAVGYGYGNTSNDSISFFMNNGSGLFGNCTSIFNGVVSTSLVPVAIAKINTDNFGDLIAQGSTQLNIYNNNGSQIFILQPLVFVGAFISQIVTGDFNSDAKMDIACSDYNNKRVCVTLGNGNGTFLPYSAYSSGGKCNHLVLGDFDIDTRIDIVATNNQTLGNFAFLKGQADGSFGSYALRTIERPFAINVGLVNNDAYEDLVVVHNSAQRIGVMLGNSDGTFQNTIYDSCWWSMSDLELGDFNNDGKLDALCIGNNPNILSGNNTGHFTIIGDVYHGFTGGGDYTSAIGYFDADANLDFAVCYNNIDSISVMLGNGDFTFDAPVKYPTGSSTKDIISYDLNSDGDLDLITACDQSNDVRIYYGNGNGTFQAPVSYGTGANPRAVCAADFNGDGFKDFAAANGNGNTLSIYLATGNGVYAAPFTHVMGNNLSMSQLKVALINADTIPDILAIDRSNADAVLLVIGNGDGTFQAPSSFTMDRSPMQIVTSDFNNDGAIDFASVNSAANNVTVVLNNSSFITVNGNTALCTGDSVQLTASNGFSYEWSTGATTSSIWVNAANTYSVSVTNQSGSCTTVPPVVIVTAGSNPNVSFNTDANGAKCVSDGSINLASIAGQPQGGTYSGSFVSNGLLNATAAGAGEHIVTYTYTNSCGTDSESDTITIDAEVLASISLPNDTFCVGGGTIILSDYSSPAGGTWGTNNNVITQVDLAQVPANTYVLQYAIVAGGCRDTAYATVEVLECTGIEELSESVLNVFPNPSNGSFIIQIEGNQKFETLQLFDVNGRKVAQQSIENILTVAVNTQLPKGIYTLQLLSQQSVVHKQVVVN